MVTKRLIYYKRHGAMRLGRGANPILGLALTLVVVDVIATKLALLPQPSILHWLQDLFSSLFCSHCVMQDYFSSIQDVMNIWHAF